MAMYQLRLLLLLCLSQEVVLKECKPRLIKGYWVYDCSFFELTAVPVLSNTYSDKIVWLNNNNITRLKQNDFIKMQDILVLYLHGNPIVKLQPNVFSLLANLRELTVTAEKIEFGAFNGLTNLKKLTINSRTKNRGHTLPVNFFIKLTKLQELNVTADSIELGAFNGLSNLEKLSIDGRETIKSLPRNLLKPLTNLKQLVITNTKIETIQKRFLSGFKNLNSINLRNNRIKLIEEGALDGTIHVTDITLNENALTAIPREVFKDLSKLSALRINSNNIKSVDENAFSLYKLLTRLEMANNGLSNLPQNIFKSNLKIENLLLQGNYLTELPGVKTGSNADSYKYIASLRHLDLSNNNFSQFIVNYNIQKIDFKFNLLVLRMRNNSMKKYIFYSNMQRFDEVDLSMNCFETRPRIPGSVKIMNISNSCLKGNVDTGLLSNSYDIVDLHGNNLTNVTSGYATGMPKLMNLSSCNINYIDLRHSTFYDGYINKIDLSYNSLSDLNQIQTPKKTVTIGTLLLKSNSITDLNKPLKFDVKTLDLSNNNITTISSTFFKSLPSLTSIDLSYNRIASIPEHLFDNAQKIKHFCIKRNHISTIPLNFLKKSEQLQTLDLSSNDLQCSCNMTITLNAMLSKKKKIFGVCKDLTDRSKNIASLVKNITELSKGAKCNLCPLSPCYYRGDCFPHGSTGFYCKCDQGFTGRNCEIDMSDCYLQQACNLCNNTVCKNSGTCREVSTTKIKCTCPAGYSGEFCETPVCQLNKNCGICNDTVCKNNGNCKEFMQNGRGSFNCSCPVGFGGDYCQDAIQCTTQASCNYKGDCIQTNKGNHCKCDLFYTGTQCEGSCVDTQTCGICNDTVCYNNGICLELKNIYYHSYFTITKFSFNCTCPVGFYGDKCQHTGQCTRESCNNRGNCTQTYSGSSKCICNTFFEGDKCEKSCIEKQTCGICKEGLCQNGGKCRESIQNGKGAFNCSCPVGFGGDYCQYAIHCTTRASCNNRGDCIQTNKGHHCKCDSIYAGVHCETSCVDTQTCGICNSTACHNNGSCIEFIKNYFYNTVSFNCTCLDGFYGDKCEHKVQCTRESCNSRGNCILTNSGNRCICDTIYEGEKCERSCIDTQTCNLCKENVCQNDGKCREVISNKNKVHSATVECECKYGFSGKHCKISDSGTCKNCTKYVGNLWKNFTITDLMSIFAIVGIILYIVISRRLRKSKNYENFDYPLPTRNS